MYHKTYTGTPPLQPLFRYAKFGLLLQSVTCYIESLGVDGFQMLLYMLTP